MLERWGSAGAFSGSGSAGRCHFSCHPSAKLAGCLQEPVLHSSPTVPDPLALPPVLPADLVLPTHLPQLAGNSYRLTAMLRRGEVSPTHQHTCSCPVGHGWPHPPQYQQGLQLSLSATLGVKLANQATGTTGCLLHKATAFKNRGHNWPP